MKGLKRFLRTTFLGGVAVLLPVILIWIIFTWLKAKVVALIGPVAEALMTASRQPRVWAEVAAVILILALCFLVGAIVRTRVGRWVHRQIEERLLTVTPGYNMIREIVQQFLGQKKASFFSTALVRPFDAPTLITAFITDRHPGGWVTVFAPSGLNPTTGSIFHLPSDRVYPLTATVEEAMRSLIACGSGTGNLWPGVQVLESLVGPER
jgi:uncharacterized membrane protein